MDAEGAPNKKVAIDELTAASMISEIESTTKAELDWLKLGLQNKIKQYESWIEKAETELAKREQSK